MRRLLATLVSALRSLVSPPSRRDPLGAQGERAAARLLRRKKFRILARNVRVRFGEADLLCLAPDRRTIVVVEVKARRVGAAEAGPLRPPEASITEHKRRKLSAVLRHLARANGWEHRPLRIDVIAIEWHESRDPAIRHHEGAVSLRA